MWAERCCTLAAKLRNKCSVSLRRGAALWRPDHEINVPYHGGEVLHSSGKKSEIDLYP